MSYTRRAIRGFSIVFAVNIIAAFIGYLIRIVLARNLTVEEYGVFFAVFTLINFLAIFNDLGMGQALVKYIPEFLVKKKPAKIKNSVFLTLEVTLASFILISVFLFAFSELLAQYYFKNDLAVPLLLLFIPLLLFSRLRGLVRNIYQAFQRMASYALMYLTENLLILVLLLCLFAFKKNIFVATYSYIAAYMLIFIIFSIILFRVFNFFKHKTSINKSLVKKMFKFGIPLMILSAGSMIILYIDTLILTYFRSLEEVGVYNVVVPTVMMVMFFGKSIASVIFPMSSELWARKKKKYIGEGLRILEKYSFVILIPVALIILAFSKMILKLMFGPEYVTGALTMQILIIGVVFFAIYAINSALFSAIGKPQIATKILLQGALINLVLNLIIIPWLGMLGAGITSLITYLYVALVSVIRLRKYIKVKMPWAEWAKIFITGGVVLTTMFILKKLLFMNIYLEIAILCLLSGLLYLSLIFAMKIININELNGFIKSRFKKFNCFK